MKGINAVYILVGEVTHYTSKEHYVNADICSLKKRKLGKEKAHKFFLRSYLLSNEAN